MTIAQSIVLGLELWGLAGAAVAAVFLTVGMDSLDEDARGAYVFRPLLVPGVVLLWPLVLWRWWQIHTEAAAWAARYRPVRAAYGAAVVAMSLAILVVVGAGLSARQSWPAEAAPVQLTEREAT